MWQEDGKNIWIWAIEDWVTKSDTSPYEIIEFVGGTFVVATGDENDGEDLNETVNCMMKWINNSEIFDFGDYPQKGMCHMTGYGSIQ